MGIYKERCGNYPSSYHPVSTIGIWWWCACKIAYNHRDICVSEELSPLHYMDEVIADVYDSEGVTVFIPAFDAARTNGEATLSLLHEGYPYTSPPFPFICGAPPPPTPPPPPPEKDFFKGIGDYFYNWTIPIVGGHPLRWLSTPFYMADDWCNTINGYVTTILSWTQIDNKIRAKYSILTMDASAFLTWLGIEFGDVITTILDSPAAMIDWLQEEIKSRFPIVTHVWQELLDAIEAVETILPDWLPTSLDELITLINDNAPSLPAWIPTSLTELKALIINTISDAFENILDKVFKED